MNPVVSVQNISKKYSRNANAHLGYGISDLWREIWGRDPDTHLRKDEFFAVQDISFHLFEGDTIGLVGRNGSGKTTLLKMMNGLIKPDTGRIELHGKVQALINLGAGFNANLSGRDNIYNAAALMGLNRRQTHSIVDEIIEFSELEDFIDSPLHTYSSGMSARLGFSVAVHLDPDILLVDEILAVGDYAFQNRCFARMQQLKKRGVTIVLVSHSHNSVIQLCKTAIWLHKGRLMQMGTSKEVVQAYLGFLEREEAKSVLERKGSDSTSGPRQRPKKKAKTDDPHDGLYGPIFDEFDKIEDLSVTLWANEEDSNCIRVHESMEIEYSFRLRQWVDDLNITLKFFRKDGLNLTTISTLTGDLLKHIHEGQVRRRCRIGDFAFNPGTYVLVIAVHEGKSYLYRNVVKEFAVLGNGRLTWGISDLSHEYEVLK